MDTFILACKQYRYLGGETRDLLDELVAGKEVDLNKDYSSVLSFLDYISMYLHDLSIGSRVKLNEMSRKIELAMEEEFDEEE